MYEYAGFWKRVLARIVDTLIIAIPNIIIESIFGGVATLIAGWLYYTLMESSSNRGTLGKMALGIEVTDEYGEQISFARANGRFFAEILSALTFFIGYIMAGFTEHKQTLHDMVTSTYVRNK